MAAADPVGIVMVGFARGRQSSTGTSGCSAATVTSVAYHQWPPRSSCAPFEAKAAPPFVNPHVGLVQRRDCRRNRRMDHRLDARHCLFLND